MIIYVINIFVHRRVASRSVTWSALVGMSVVHNKRLFHLILPALNFSQIKEKVKEELSYVFDHGALIKANYIYTFVRTTALRFVVSPD